MCFQCIRSEHIKRDHPLLNKRKVKKKKKVRCKTGDENDKSESNKTPPKKRNLVALWLSNEITKLHSERILFL